MAKIGETFAAELMAAGVPLDGLSWDVKSGALLAGDGEDHLAAAAAVLARHDPSKTLPVVIHVLKVDIWRRVSDAEAVGLVQLLGTQSVRLQRMFNDATVISSADEMWPVLLGGITQVLGADRASVILAPSTE